ncbi:uncharacterized protein [Nicotiana sylvestris]|uniref:uncharacterized protein n=1 Tax=Nicotiana sylvestris TaxID=4096 RepID=UPI00388C7BA1
MEERMQKFLNKVQAYLHDSESEIKRSDSGVVVQLLHSVLDDWRNEFIEYIRHGNLLEDPKASRSLRTKAARCCLVDGQLYTRSFQRPLALCLGASEADYMMREVHEGVCGNHLGTDSLVLKLVKVGYYWPHMEQDAKAFVQKCDKCQRHAQFVHQLAILLHLVVSPWPFMK